MNKIYESCNGEVYLNGDLPEQESLIVNGGCCSISDGTSKSNDYLKKSNYLSEFLTELEKAKVRKNLGITDGYSLKWGNIEGDVKQQKDLMDLLESLRDSSKHYYTSVDRPEITNVKQALDTLLYIPLSINYFTVTPSEAEIGETITNLIYNWKYNKTSITSQKFDNEQIDLSIRTKTLSGTFTNNISKQLEVSDGTNTISKVASTTFKEGRYYGVSTSDPNSETIVSTFTRNLNLNKGGSFTVNAQEGEYIYLLVPESLKDIEFVVGGFSGGFSIVNDNYQFTRYEGTTVKCVLFKSDNPNLGNTTITIR